MPCLECNERQAETGFALCKECAVQIYKELGDRFNKMWTEEFGKKEVK